MALESLLLQIDEYCNEYTGVEVQIKGGKIVLTGIWTSETGNYQTDSKGEEIIVDIPPMTDTGKIFEDAIENFNSTTFGADYAIILVGIAAGVLTGGWSVAATLVLNEIAVLSAYSDMNNTQKEAVEEFITVLGMSFDENGEIEYTLYSVFMMMELANEYNENPEGNLGKAIRVINNPDSTEEEIKQALYWLETPIDNADGRINDRIRSVD